MFIFTLCDLSSNSLVYLDMGKTTPRYLFVSIILYESHQLHIVTSRPTIWWPFSMMRLFSAIPHFKWPCLLSLSLFMTTLTVITIAGILVPTVWLNLTFITSHYWYHWILFHPFIRRTVHPWYVQTHWGHKDVYSVKTTTTRRNAYHALETTSCLMGHVWNVFPWRCVHSTTLMRFTV